MTGLLLAFWGTARFLAAPAPDAGARAPTLRAQGDADETGRVASDPLPAGGQLAAERSALPGQAPGELDGGLRGSARDEAGRALAPGSVELVLSGPSRQHIAVAVDGDGLWGPVPLVAGRWELRARAPGHSAVERSIDWAPGTSNAPLELVLQRIAPLEVRLLAQGGAAREQLDASLLELVTLLSLRFVSVGEPQVATLVLQGLGDPGGIELRAQLRRPWGHAGRLELLLGGELVDQHAVAPAAQVLDWVIDPLALRARLVALRIALYAPGGEPLELVSLATLSWGEVGLTAGQPEAGSHSVFFPVCPPGAAHLRVLHGDGLSSSTELFVPFEGPLELELRLEPDAVAGEG